MLRTPPLGEPRIYAKTRHVWIYPEPDVTRQWIGFLWTGGSVKRVDAEPRAGNGCARFYAIEPEGYVCVDERRATIDATDPLLVALTRYAPRTDSPWLHRYGESKGVFLYPKLPSEEEQRWREPGFKGKGLALDAGTSFGFPLPDLSQPPVGLFEPRDRLLERSTVAYSVEGEHLGRRFLLTSDYRFIPKDRVVEYPMSRFAGVWLGKDAELPLAFFRDDGVPRLRRDPTGKLVDSQRPFERLSFVQLTGKEMERDQVPYLETRAGDWVERAKAVVPEIRSENPFAVAADAGPPRGRETWLEVSITGGWLVAYQGVRPVFVTLISPGRGGPPVKGRKPIETGSTPTGRFVITGKFMSASMVAPTELTHSEVPYAQNFSGPYALHSAYWHDRFGHPMSGGCINLSPIDGQRLFAWTEPDFHPGWYGQRWLPKKQPATHLLIRP